MTRCEETVAIQVDALQKIMFWRQRMQSKLTLGGIITITDIEGIDPPVDALAETVGKCR